MDTPQTEPKPIPTGTSTSRTGSISKAPIINPSPSALPTTQSNGTPLIKFCNAMGIDPRTGLPLPHTNSLYRKIHHNYLKYSTQYYFISQGAFLILTLQVVLSAAASVLAAYNHHDNAKNGTAIVILGAITSVISFFAGYLKSQGQPTRARQFRDALRRVRDAVDEALALFKMGEMDGAGSKGNGEGAGENTENDVASVVKRLMDMYNQAMTDGEANMPDVWVEGNKKAGKVAPKGSMPV